MITLSMRTLRAAASQRPPGYLEDVLSRAESIEGDNVHFFEADYYELVAKYSGPTEEEKKRHEPICRSCEWINPATWKCHHPKCGCPISPLRVEPWLNLKDCPLGKFTSHR